MTSLLPWWINALTIAILVLVSCYRCVRINTNRTQRYVNNFFVLILFGEILRTRYTQNTLGSIIKLNPVWIQQFGLIFILLSAIELIGFLFVWYEVRPGSVAHSNWLRRSVGYFLCFLFFVFGARSRAKNIAMNSLPGWDSTASWTIAQGIVFITGILITFCSVKEGALKIKDQRAPADKRSISRIASRTMLCIGIINFWTCVIGIASVVADTLSVTHSELYVFSFLGYVPDLSILLLAGVCGISVVRNEIAYQGLDRTSILWRKLQPLRTELENLSSEKIDPLYDEESSRRKTELILHRSIVEIRDYMMCMQFFYKTVGEKIESEFLEHCEKNDRREARDSLRLAQCIQVKLHGSSLETGNLTEEYIISSRFKTLHDTAAYFVKINKYLPAAKQFLLDRIYGDPGWPGTDRDPLRPDREYGHAEGPRTGRHDAWRSSLSGGGPNTHWGGRGPRLGQS